MLRRIQRIEPINQVRRHQHRIDHDALGIDRMRRHPLDLHRRRRRVERLEDELAHLATVDGVGKIHRKAREVHHFGPAQPDLLIRHKSHHDIAMRRPLAHQLRQQVHHDRHRRLVVRPQHAGPVRHQQLLVHVRQKLRMLAHAHPNVLPRIQADIAAVKEHTPRLDLRRQPNIHRIDMRAKPDPRHPRHRRRQPRSQAAMLVQMDIRQPKRRQLTLQQPHHVPLPRRARHHGGAEIALAGHRKISKESRHQPLGQPRIINRIRHRPTAPHQHPAAA